MDYTICAKVVQRAKLGNRYSYDLLLPLTSSNIPHRIVINDKIVEEYQKHSNEIIRTWLNGITHNEYYKIVEIEEYKNLFPDTCRLTRDATLIVCEKEDYDENVLNGLNVIDKDEAINDIRPNTTLISVVGDENKLSTGNNSPINE